jgi:hypothetical protein
VLRNLRALGGSRRRAELAKNARISNGFLSVRRGHVGRRTRLAALRPSAARTLRVEPVEQEDAGGRRFRPEHEGLGDTLEERLGVARAMNVQIGEGLVAGDAVTDHSGEFDSDGGINRLIGTCTSRSHLHPDPGEGARIALAQPTCATREDRDPLARGWELLGVFYLTYVAPVRSNHLLEALEGGAIGKCAFEPTPSGGFGFRDACDAEHFCTE